MHPRRLLAARVPGFSYASCVFDDTPTKAGCARRRCAVAGDMWFGLGLASCSLVWAMGHGPGSGLWGPQGPPHGFCNQCPLSNRPISACN
jgi:hypothetical protein